MLRKALTITGAYNTGHTATVLRNSAKIAKATSYVCNPLSEMPAVALMEDDKDVEFG